MLESNAYSYYGRAMKRKLHIGYLCLLVLSGCASIDPLHSLQSENYDDSNSGIVLFKTLRGDPEQKRVAGTAIAFHQLGTENVIQNVKGLGGWPAQVHYALRLSPGDYELSSVFFHDGFMHPKDQGFSFSIGAGDVAYIGTILTSWDITEPPDKYGEVIGIKEYKRDEICLIVKKCEVDAEVIVVDQGQDAVREFVVEFPSLQFEKISTESMR